MSPKKRTRTQRYRQKGATLIEVLVTMLVVALGLLGAASIQLASIKYQQTSAFRNEAIEQANFIVERIRVNSSILTLDNLPVVTATPESGYIAADSFANATTLPTDPNCGLSGLPDCTAAQSAQRDLREWRESLSQSLPEGRGSIFPVTVGATTEANSRRIVVMWREKSQFETDTVANLGQILTDPACPAPRVDGIRCINLWVTP